MKKLSIGVDMGATKIYVGAVTSKGEILHREMILTMVERPWEEIADDVAEGVKKVLKKVKCPIDEIGGVGIGCPGAISKDKAVVRESANFGWVKVPLQKYISDKLNVPVKLENDANLGVLGVGRFGEAKNSQILVGVFVGSGIGGGVLFNGKIFDGVGGSAAEVGHMVVQIDGPKCGCGANGCWEAVAARLALYRSMEAYATGEGKNTKAGREYLSAKNKAQALINGCKMEDPGVLKIIHESGRVLGIGISNLINLFNPDMVAIGGGVVEDLSSWIMPPLLRAVKKTAMKAPFKEVKIVETKLGNNAILLGAAALVMPGAQSD